MTTVTSDPSYIGYINYGWGYKWRIIGWITVSGTLKDQDGQPIANAPVTLLLNERLGKQSVSGTTTASGTYSLNIPSLNPGAGDYSYYASASTHYFDVIGMGVASSLSNSSETYVDTLYHFAYSIYHPF
ncbi:carboxypeptidase-like regulatory domain-containing protein [Tumebacillus permanentifrigoris]|uniref:Carboxypeptidase family protein n=1 Tax=Tumebacillus permanentifrigoris TaxID=378543 RepID=A0A316DCI3_9BACL|nr:carboxypeptidase-like regulatory domain-containing protein [Tumebacillus permanentifrigoris]PWK13943.1 carboxypeptidase family protein [Tumebacillus permanentifrigoris]